MFNELAQQLHAAGKQEELPNPAVSLMLIVSKLAEAMDELHDGRGVNEPGWLWHSTPRSLPLEITVTDGHQWLFYGTPAQRKLTEEDYKNAGWLAKPIGVPNAMAEMLMLTLKTCAAWEIDIDEAVARISDYQAHKGELI